MKTSAKKLVFSAVAPTLLALLTVGADDRTQMIPLGSGTNFSSVVYCDPPNEQQIKARVSGAEMWSLPGVLYNVKKLKIETFGTNGEAEAVAEAPQCIYAPLDGVANSPGHLDMSLYGKIHIQGEGFLWQQSPLSLMISNQQRTIIKMGNWKMITP